MKKIKYLGLLFSLCFCFSAVQKMSAQELDKNAENRNLTTADESENRTDLLPVDAEENAGSVEFDTQKAGIEQETGAETAALNNDEREQSESQSEEELNADEAESSDESLEDEKSGTKKTKRKVSKKHQPGISDVPAEKRPEKQDKEKLEQLEIEFPDTKKENSETLKYGMEEDIIKLLDKLVKNEDVRFVDDVYDLFQDTKNTTVREKILEYFTKLKDPCLEDYAVMILNDPYDEKNSTVSAVFNYIQAVKTQDAIPAVLTLLENEEENYFNNALTTIGEIGGPEEAVYLTEYLEREDLVLGQRQQLVKVLGKIKAVETYDSLVELAQDEDENTFVRMYSAEAIGAMQKEEAVEVLTKLYEDNDPKLRSYVIKGLAYFPDNKAAVKTLLEAIRDSHVSVRLEAIEACRKNNIKEAVPFMIYRLEKDKEDSVKKKCYPAIAELNTDEGNEYLIKQITDKKVADTPKSRIASALLEFNHTGTDEIIALARETLQDDRRKPLRYALGKEFAKYKRSEFAQICNEYLDSKDTATQGTGLDIYAKGRYPEVTKHVQSIVLDDANNSKGRKNANAQKAARILGSSDSAVVEAKEIKDKKDAEADAKAKAAQNKKSGNDKKSDVPKSTLEMDAK